MAEKQLAHQSGFSLTELLAAMSILGVLSAVALPSYLDQLERNNQAKAKAEVQQLISLTAAHNDEFGTPAKGWSDLDEIATIMTNEGPASGVDFENIETSDQKYILCGKQEGVKYTFEAVPKDKDGALCETSSNGVAPIEDQAPSDQADQNISSNSTDDVANAYTLNILACLDVATGATDIQSGTNTQRAEIADLKCPT